MPQPKSSSSRSSGRSSSARSSGSRSTASRSGGSRSSGPGSTGSRSSGSRSAGSRSTGARSSGTRSTRAQKSAPAPTSAVDEAASQTLASLRDYLSRGIVLTADRLQETMEDAVKRGRLTRADAEDLVTRLVTSGRKQTEDLIGELDALAGRSRSEIATAGRRVRTQARRAAGPGGDRVLREVDRARRAVGIGPTFPILGYDELAAAQIIARLEDLNSAQLRKVRDYERRHANRKSVLDAIERKLA